jgi:uncharacterized protein (TIGR00725 family)
MKVISVFGSSQPQSGSADYEMARQMGRLLAEQSFAVQTGGYSGVMEAVSRGAREVGGHVIGVTSAQIELFRPLPANEWVIDQIRHETLQERLIYLIKNCDGAVVMSGGIGTLAELALMWSYLQIGEIPPRPVVAVGGQWARTLSAFISPEYIRPDHAALILRAKTPKEAIKTLIEQF